MEFTVEFYETNAGRRPVEEFLLKLKASDPDDFTVRSQTEFGNEEALAIPARDLDTTRERMRDWKKRNE